MGIAGLVPFIVKKFPDIVKILPERFKAFEGKAIAIDGNLITSRFWFSPDPHHSRHVRGWYRLVQELQRSSVGVICVFDGPSRSSAKAAEVFRREQTRKLYAGRAKIEADRAHRLQKLTSAVETYNPFAPQTSVSRPQKAPLGSPANLGAVDALPLPSGVPASNDSAGLPKRLADLYKDYRRSSRQENLMPVVSASPVTISDFVTPDDAFPMELPGVPTPSAIAIPTLQDVGHNGDVAMSKMQSHLATEEARVWTSVLDGLDATASAQPDTSGLEGPQDSLHHRVQTLADASDHLLQSYTRRQEPPDRKVYEESHTILQAMGVPVLVAPFPYEAEGVAASLCAHGLADMVGSEDTDVLVYGAPLIRNLTTRDDPLIQISPTEVREALNLTQSSFLDFALLLGSDFTQRLHGLGPVKALKLIQSEGTIENIIRSQKELPLTTGNKKPATRRFLPEPQISEEEYLEQIAMGRQIFTTLPPIDEDVKAALRNPGALAVDLESLAEILRGFDLRPERFDDGTGVSDQLDVDFYGSEMMERSGDQPGTGAFY